MRKSRLAALVGLSLLTGCSSANIAANEAWLAAALNETNADISLIYAGLQQNCAAIQVVVADAGVAACLIAGNPSKVAQQINTAVSAANAACEAATSSSTAPALQGLAATISAGYNAAKSAQGSSVCGGT